MVKTVRFLIFLTVSLLQITSGWGWQWSDFIVGGGTTTTSTSSSKQQQQQKEWLSMSDVSQMRARDIKRRLSRQHGYGADELARILDKKELIRALAFEEYKIQQVHDKKMKSLLMQRALIVSIAAVVIMYCWPLLRHLWQVAWVNLVVYYDKKVYEAQRCRELSSVLGLVGVTIMLVMDVLQIWLTASVILSWVMTSVYFFPVPSISIRPAQLMGGAIAGGANSNNNPLSGYGINVGPMIVTWALRFGHGRVEAWTGRALSRAMQYQKQQARAQETPEAREARKAEKRARKAARQQAEADQLYAQQCYQQQQQQQQYNGGHGIWPVDDNDNNSNDQIAATTEEVQRRHDVSTNNNTDTGTSDPIRPSPTNETEDYSSVWDDLD